MSDRNSESEIVCKMGLETIAAAASSSSSSTTTAATLTSPAAEVRKRRPSDELIPDANVLSELETHARSIASSLDMALRDLRGSLRGMSDLTSETMQVFGTVVNSTCDQVDSAIRSTYTMLAKAEEFNESMRGVQKLLQQIKDIKRLLDLFEAEHMPMPSAPMAQPE